MHEYKFYLIRADGHIKGPAIQYVLPDDSTAIKTANLIAMSDDIEIWEGPRLVAYVVNDETKQKPPVAKTSADQHK